MKWVYDAKTSRTSFIRIENCFDPDPESGSASPIFANNKGYKLLMVINHIQWLIHLPRKIILYNRLLWIPIIRMTNFRHKTTFWVSGVIAILTLIQILTLDSIRIRQWYSIMLGIYNVKCQISDPSPEIFLAVNYLIFVEGKNRHKWTNKK